jgi:hypothetical protein
VARGPARRLASGGGSARVQAKAGAAQRQAGWRPGARAAVAGAAGGSAQEQAHAGGEAPAQAWRTWKLKCWAQCRAARAEVVLLGADARQRRNGRGGGCWRDVAARAGADGTQCTGVQALERGGWTWASERCGIKRWSDGLACVEAWQRAALVAWRCADGAKSWWLEVDPHGG